MLYTIIGGLSGFVLTSLYCKLYDVDMNRSRIIGLSQSDVYIALGTLTGASIGLGYGIASLSTGSHMLYKIL